MDLNKKIASDITNKKYSLIHGDSLELMKQMDSNSVDVIVADPPYFLSNDGFSNSGGKRVSVNKGDWDKIENPDKFYETFLNESYRLLKPNGTIWVFGSMHNIYKIGNIFSQDRWKILNNITWQKSNPAPNLSRRMFTHSTETILWVKKNKGKQLFNYELMREINGGKQMKDVWTTSTISPREKNFGKHPTQKPISLIKRILLASTNEDSVVLDPFVGSGTTIVGTMLLNRKGIGIDIEQDFIDLTRKRLDNLENVYQGDIR